MIKINDMVIDARETDFGVKFEGDDFALVCADKDAAVLTANMTGGTLVSREVFMGPWESVNGTEGGNSEEPG